MQKRFIPTTIDMICPSILERVSFMASDEMEKVRELDLELLRGNKDKLRLYYGVEDGWAPLKFCKKLQSTLPEVRVESCKRNFDHAYILRYSEEAADMITDWIRVDL